jgi:hypothetical protein
VARPTAYMLRPLRPWTPPRVTFGAPPLQRAVPEETFPAGTRVHYARHPAAGFVVRPVGSRRAFWVEDGDLGARPPGPPVPRVEAPALPVKDDRSARVWRWVWGVVLLTYGCLGLVMMGVW